MFLFLKYCWHRSSNFLFFTLHSDINGFRSNKSTSDALIHIAKEIFKLVGSCSVRKLKHWSQLNIEPNYDTCFEHWTQDLIQPSENCANRNFLKACNQTTCKVEQLEGKLACYLFPQNKVKLRIMSLLNKSRSNTLILF